MRQFIPKPAGYRLRCWLGCQTQEAQRALLNDGPQPTVRRRGRLVRRLMCCSRAIRTVASRRRLGPAGRRPGSDASVRRDSDSMRSERRVGGLDVPASGGRDLVMFDPTRDISVRNGTDEELRRSRDLLAAIAASSDDAIMAKDMDDRLTTWNPGAERLYGYTAAEIIGQPSLRLVPPERAEEMYRILERLQRGERVEHFETVRLRKDGSRFDVSVSVAPLMDAAGRVVGASAIARDITERKRAERELEARARQQAAVADLGQRALARTDLSALLDEAVALVARTLEVDYCALLELVCDGAALRFRAGVGWPDEVMAREFVPAGPQTQAGYTLATGVPVIVEDFRTERRFQADAMLREHGAISGISVILRAQEHPYGTLSVHTTQPRRFSTDDVH